MLTAEQDFDASPHTRLTLAREHNVPKVILRAMQGRPLTYEALQELAGESVPGAQLLITDPQFGEVAYSRLR